MYTNVNLAAPIGVLALLGTALLLFLLGLLFFYSLGKRRFALTKFVVLAATLLTGLYFAVLLTFSFASSERVLARGDEKHFCEIDCHLAYSVAAVRESKTVGEAPNQVTAAGMFRIVTIKTRFDETTISPNRGNGLLYPNARVVSIVDESGREHFPATEAQRVLENSHTSGTAMTIPLRPGESYSTTLAFDVPPDVSRATLVIREGDLVTHFVIGHENSPLHKKISFQL
ncbi:MAG TPA: hypothetical protein VK208_17795 [Pyrinomonadaceae bacterium]|nr:hypothetical protein [Pyrinomonadaceae bacterium]